MVTAKLQESRLGQQRALPVTGSLLLPPQYLQQSQSGHVEDAGFDKFCAQAKRKKAQLCRIAI
jgi:hypothetical protein